MGKRAIRKKLEKLVGTRQKVRITRPFPGDPSCNGFVVGLNADWVLVHQFNDFDPDGY